MLVVDVNCRIMVCCTNFAYKIVLITFRFLRPLHSVAHIDHDLLESLMVIWDRNADCEGIKAEAEY